MVHKWCLGWMVGVLLLAAGCNGKHGKENDLAQFKQSYQCSGCDLQEVDLSHFDPLAANSPMRELLSLRKANLTKAKLDEIHLPGCSKGLDEACFNKVDLTEANLTGASLRKARLHAVDFTQAILRASRWDRAICGFCNFSKADFSHAELTYMDSSQVNSMAGTGSTFDEANFSHADLSHAALSGSFVKTNFSHAKLHFAKLEGADDGLLSDNPALSGAERDILDGDILWAGANFTDADLSGATIKVDSRGNSLGDLHKVILCRTRMPDGTINNRDC